VSVRPIFVLGLAVLALAGCIRGESRVVEELVQTAPGEFRFTATASMLHPLNSTQAEQHRLRRLEALVGERKLCPAGYDVVGRDPAFGPQLPRNEYVLRDVVYFGRCR
jgi:hypothetical protein